MSTSRHHKTTDLGKPTMPVKDKVKPKKILRDNIQGITKPAIARLCQRAGIQRISGLMYDEIRGVLTVKMEEIMMASSTMCEFNRRSTVKTVDLESALEVTGIYLGAGSNPNTGKTIGTCKSRPRGKGKKEEEDGAGPKKAHRFRPGTVALREIRFQQKNSDCFALPKANFSRLAREIGQNYNDNLRYSKSFMELFQLVIEDYLINILSNSNLCALHADRQTVMPKDIQLVRRIHENQLF